MQVLTICSQTGSQSDIDPKLLQMTAHLDPQLGKLGLERVDLLLDRGDVDFFRRFECIDVTRDVEVEVVLRDLVDRYCARIALDIFSRAMCRDNLPDVLVEELILVLARLEITARVDEEDVGASFQSSECKRAAPSTRTRPSVPRSRA